MKRRVPPYPLAPASSHSVPKAPVQDRKGALWFLGMDPCGVLGFSTPQDAYTRLDDSEKSYVARTDVGMKPGRPLVVISESGLYKLIPTPRYPVKSSARIASHRTRVSRDLANRLGNVPRKSR